MCQYGREGDEREEEKVQTGRGEETKTDLLAGRLAVLAGSVSGPVRDSAFRDRRIESPTILP